jgi:hypothetical protein
MYRAVRYQKWHSNRHCRGVGEDDLHVLCANAALPVLKCSYFVVNSFSSSEVHFMSLRKLQHSDILPPLIQHHKSH